MVVTDFAIENLALEFDLGIDSALYQSSVNDVRCGLGFKPAGNAAAGLTIYNTDNPTVYGNVSLSINPEVPDTLLLVSKSHYDGVLVSNLYTNLNIVTLGSISAGNILINNDADVSGNVNVTGSVIASNFINTSTQSITSDVPGIDGLTWTGPIYSIYNLTLTDNVQLNITGTNNTYIGKTITFLFNSVYTGVTVTFNADTFQPVNNLTILTMSELHPIQFTYNGTRWVETSRGTTVPGL